ncbi:SDR family NAD(P)-dependent oxidoreductase, partial [Phenylobacterium sp.]|uniref:SDR family NAD(P)-dependent oxidoreductase n=1 Tax=Phenylobacterium sp. TaxID=1871053 RepID=UPI002E3214F8
MAADGFDVVLTARRASILQDVAELCRERGASALVVPGDVSRAEDLAAVTAAAIDRFGGFDVWVSNAGVLQFGRIEETPAAAIERVLFVNIAGTMFSAQEAIRHFRARGRGVLISTASVLGVVGQPFAAAYVASKFAIRGMSESLRQEVRDVPGIHVCTVLSSAIDSPVYSRAANYMGREMRPIWWLYPPETVARTIVRLARKPRREALAGRTFGAATLIGKTLSPGLAERFT